MSVCNVYEQEAIQSISNFVRTVQNNIFLQGTSEQFGAWVRSVFQLCKPDNSPNWPPVADTLTGDTPSSTTKGSCVIIYYQLVSYGCVTLALKLHYLQYIFHINNDYLLYLLTGAKFTIINFFMIPLREHKWLFCFEADILRASINVKRNY